MIVSNTQTVAEFMSVDLWVNLNNTEVKHLDKYSHELRENIAFV